MSGKQRNFRKTRATSEEPGDDGPSVSGRGADDATECQRDKLEEVKLLQKLRKRDPGMGASKLAVGDKSGAAALVQQEDDDEEAPTGLTDAFSAAAPVAKSDIDPQMEKYIQEELAKRLGRRAAGLPEEDAEALKRQKIEEDLYAVPEQFRAGLGQKDAPVVGMGMTGISEVTLTKADRMKKIEETESIKQGILSAAGHALRLPGDMVHKPAQSRANRGELPSSFGRHQPVRMKDLDQDKLEEVRRRVVTETRPMPKVGRAEADKGRAPGK